MRKARTKLKMNRMSIYQIKKKFSHFLYSELREYNFVILIGFEVMFTDKLCCLKKLKNNKFRLIINLNYINKALPIISCSFMDKILYCCLFIVQFLTLLESVKHELPKSYFEGLVYFNAIEIFNRKNTELYSPVSHWNKKNKGSFCIKPIEIHCAINALEKIVLAEDLALDERDRISINAFKDELRIYSNFPEISYIQKKTPVYTVVNSLKEISKQIEKNPSVTQEFPILSLLPCNQIKELTIKDLFLFCAESNNDFLIELAIRLVAFFHFAYTLDYKNNDYERVIEEMKNYISTYAKFHSKISMQENYFLQDNFSAVKNAVKEINCFLCMNGITVSSGNIHIIN